MTHYYQNKDYVFELLNFFMVTCRSLEILCCAGNVTDAVRLHT